MAVNLWVSGESWQIVYGASGRAKGRGVNSYTSRWLDPTHGTRALSSVTVLVAGGRRAAEPCCGTQAAWWAGRCKRGRPAHCATPPPRRHCTALLPTARQRPNSRFFRAAMSIAKRIWPAILIDSKFSTKLYHGTGLSPIFSDWKERFLLKRLPLPSLHPAAYCT